MRSLKTRLILVISSLVLLAVALTTLVTAATTEDSIGRTLDEQRDAEDEIVAELTSQAFLIGSWAETQPVVDELADEFSAQIVLTDLDGRRLVNSPGGDPSRLVGLIDPFSPFAILDSDISFTIDELNAGLVDCFESTGIPYETDEFGNLFPLVEDEFAKECYDAATQSFIEGGAIGVAQPALLFVDFSVSPDIPWASIGVVATAVVAAAVVAAVVVSGLISRPISRMAAAVHAVRQGDLDVRVDADSPAEVAELAVSFNEMTEELARADERRRRLTADVAHELRSPLTNMIGHLDAINDSIIEPTSENYRIVTQEAIRLGRLVEDLQELTDLDQGLLALSRKPTDVKQVVTAAVEARRARARGQSIDLDVSGGTSRDIEIDPARLEQVVGNLLDNALEHTPAGGSISVAISDSESMVTITVSDTGPGIAADLLPFVFDRLSRADAARTRRSEGRGLGLAIAKGLVTAHDGDISVTNMERGGASFVVTLPRSEGV